MIRNYIMSSLNYPFALPRATDDERAGALIEGKLRLGDRLVNVDTSSSFDEVGSRSRHDGLVLHSLRWLDVLRRVRADRGGAAERWSQIFDTWWECAAAKSTHSIAWDTGPVEQRSVAIALGAPDGSRALETIPQHLKVLAEAEARIVTAKRRLKLLGARLALQARRGDADEALLETALNSASQVLHEGGYVVEEDLAATAEAVGEWDRYLVGIGLRSDHPLLARARATSFWEHATAPDGGLVSLGSEIPERVPGAETLTSRYIISRGEHGVPPRSLRHVDGAGLVSVRSGWGETEKRIEDETHMTVVSGPVRGRSAHHDPGRITYFSQGRSWLIDPGTESARGIDTHSVIVLHNVVYRMAGRADLAQQYSDDHVEGYVLETSLYKSVKWRRHVVFVNTGNYVVVEDTVAGGACFSGVQQWIAAPDLEVETSSKGFVLRDGAKAVAISVSTAKPNRISFDELKDSHGKRIAWRLRIPVSGYSVRAVAVISDIIDAEQFKAEIATRINAGFSVDVRDRHLDETLVVTPLRAALVPPGTTREAAIERVVESAVSGGLPREDLQRQRVDVRHAIQAIKSSVHKAGGTLADRRKGIDELLEIGRELRVTGTRDHAFSAALIDLAGSDRHTILADHQQITHSKRAPLMQWRDEVLTLPGSSAQIYTTREATDDPAASGTPYVWSVDLGQLVPSAYVVDTPGAVLTAFFHGASDRNRFSMPRYERVRSMQNLGLGPMMFFSDPCLDLDNQMVLSWYAGSEDVDLHFEIAKMIDSHAKRIGVEKILLVGNSGGGFAALQVGAFLRGARVVSFNPQVRIDHYVPRLSKVAHLALFGHESVADNSRLAPRMNALLRAESVGFEQHVTLIQNPADGMHFRHHFLPYQAAFRASANSDLLEVHTPNLGPGHRVPPPREYLEYVQNAAMKNPHAWSFEGLRAIGSARANREGDNGCRANRIR